MERFNISLSHMPSSNGKRKALSFLPPFHGVILSLSQCTALLRGHTLAWASKQHGQVCAITLQEKWQELLCQFEANGCFPVALVSGQCGTWGTKGQCWDRPEGQRSSKPAPRCAQVKAV